MAGGLGAQPHWAPVQGTSTPTGFPWGVTYIIAENRTNFKAIYKIVNGLLHRKQESPLPPITPLSKLAEEFSEFFDSKIAKIMNQLQSNIEGDPQ